MDATALRHDLDRAARASDVSFSGLYELFLGFHDEDRGTTTWGRCYTFATIEELDRFASVACDCHDACHVRYPADFVARARTLSQLRIDRANAAALASSTPF